MYKFRPATDRIKYMRELIRDRVIRNDAERMMIITDAYKKNENVVPIIKRPLALLELCKRMSIIVEDFEIIVGNKGPHYFSSVQYPEWGVSDWVVEPIKRGEWTLREDGLYHNPDNEEIRLTISPEDYEYISENLEYWKTRKVGSVADAWQPEYFQELKRLNVSSYAEGGMSLILLPAGHLVAGYEKIINTGYAAIRKQAQDWIDSHYGNLMGEDIDKYMFYKSAVITCDAATTLIRRYAARCAEKALTEVNPKRKKELEMMADGLEGLSEKPARTFWEAGQGVMMYQVLIQIESLLPSPALGRFDQYTWPFLKRDLEEGRITLDEAQEIVDAFFLKANCFYGGGPSKLTNTTGIGNTYQHTTIGGVDPDTGEDACNPVTYMVLETVGRLKLHDPTISLRFNKNSPDSIWELALETSKLVGGLPLYQNDEVIIPALMDQLGFSLRDARDYGIIGCQEIVGCGNDYPAPNGMHPPHASVWWGSIFNMAINNGINPFNGEQASLKTGYLYEMTSIDQIKQAVEAMGRHIMRMFVSTNNYAEYLSQYYAPQAILSISIDGCMEKGKDVVAGEPSITATAVRQPGLPPWPTA
jgi:formate C-acetyltransferase